MARVYIALFMAPRAQIEPVIHSFHSFTPMCAKWPLTTEHSFTYIRGNGGEMSCQGHNRD